MARRQRESNLDALLNAPWWVSAILAAGGFVFFRWLLPTVTAGSPLTRMVGLAFQRFGVLVAAMFGLLALVLLVRQRPWRSTEESPRKDYRGLVSVPATAPAITKPDAVAQTWESLMAKPKSRPELPVPKPSQWSFDLLQQIEWKRFEELCAAFYREIGLRSETIRCGVNGRHLGPVYGVTCPSTSSPHRQTPTPEATCGRA
jgi:restriction system protein